MENHRLYRLASRVSLPAISLLPLQLSTALTEPETQAAACATLAAGLVLIPTVILGLNIALLVWVARDSKARGMERSSAWMALVMLTSGVGLLVYLFARPHGRLPPCPHCNQLRLEAFDSCPHCADS